MRTGPVGTRSTTRAIRHANRFAVLRAVYSIGDPTRKDVADRTGLSAATVSTMVAELISIGLLAESGRQESGGGRPSARLRVDAGHGLLVGVDVGETYVHADVFDAALNRLSRHEQPTTAPAEAGPVIAQVARLLRRAIDAYAGRRVIGVGVSLPGSVEPSSGVSVFAPNWGWRDVPAERLLREELGQPVHLDNPLKAATVAELWFGHGRSTGDLVTITLGTGVGAGIAVEGQLVRGITNNAGEWGHTTLVYDGRPCRCGRRGCIEAYIGVPALMAAFADRYGAAHRYLADSGQAAFVAAVAAGLARDEPESRWLVDRFGRQLGAGLADAVNMINPRLVVLTGWVASQLAPWLLPVAGDAMLAGAIAGSATAVDLVVSAVPGSAVAVGMATLALESHLEGMYAPHRRGGPSPHPRG